MRLNLYPVADARVRAQAPHQNQGDRHHLYVGRRGRGNRYRTFIRFELPEMPVWILSSASLRIFQERRYGAPRPLLLDLYGVTTAWEERHVTWDNQPDRDSRPTTSCPAPAVAAWLEFDAAPLCRQWLAGERANYGLALVSRDESTEGLTVTPSRRHADAALWPRLCLSFDAPPGRRIVTRDMGAFASADSWRSTPAFDATGLETVTAFAIHLGGGAVVVRVEASFDGTTWFEDDFSPSLVANNVRPLTARHFARFLRLGYRSETAGRPGTLRAVFQGTT